MNKRDYIGIIGWGIVSVFIGTLALPLMIWREHYQWKKYLEPLGIDMEWEDVARYGFVISCISPLNWYLICKIIWT